MTLYPYTSPAVTASIKGVLSGMLSQIFQSVINQNSTCARRFLAQSLMLLVFCPTQLACGILQVKEGYRLGYLERAVPPSPWNDSPKDLGGRILVPIFSRQNCTHLSEAKMYLSVWRQKCTHPFEANLYNLFAAKYTVLGPQSWYQHLKSRTKDPELRGPQIEIRVVFANLVP